jgi:hypothetical protein
MQCFFQCLAQSAFGVEFTGSFCALSLARWPPCNPEFAGLDLRTSSSLMQIKILKQTKAWQNSKTNEGLV